jgi:uncharacterized YigZ family protein
MHSIDNEILVCKISGFERSRYTFAAMSILPDSFLTLAAPATGAYKDRGSKFIAYACPVTSEDEAMSWVEALRREHFKARHHCFAWRLGLDGHRFRANDDGEPSGTAGRPILGQIDAAGLTDVVVVVVRYFGGTLLGTAGLIQAYRESAAAALLAAAKVEKIVQDRFRVRAAYALVPDLLNALRKLDLKIQREEYDGAGGQIAVDIRKSETSGKLLHLKAALWKVHAEDAQTLDWPEGIEVERMETP